MSARESDYYLILGVSETATMAEIRSAYRRAARESHPDVNPGDATASARFVALQRAYDVLSDPLQRAAYRRPSPQVVRASPTRSPADHDWPTSLPHELHETLVAVRVIARRARPKLERRFRQLIRYLERL